MPEKLVQIYYYRVSVTALEMNKINIAQAIVNMLKPSRKSTTDYFKLFCNFFYLKLIDWQFLFEGETSKSVKPWLFYFI